MAGFNILSGNDVPTLEKSSRQGRSMTEESQAILDACRGMKVGDRIAISTDRTGKGFSNEELVLSRKVNGKVKEVTTTHGKEDANSFRSAIGTMLKNSLASEGMFFTPRVGKLVKPIGKGKARSFYSIVIERVETPIRKTRKVRTEA